MNSNTFSTPFSFHFDVFRVTFNYTLCPKFDIGILGTTAVRRLVELVEELAEDQYAQRKKLIAIKVTMISEKK